MNLKRILTALFIAATCGAVYSQENKTYFLHTIEKGQSLYSIASMYGVSQADIIALNPGSDRKIFLGSTLRIPRTTATAQTGAETFHTIAAGETLYGLSVKYGVPAIALSQANPGLSASNFRTGQVIRIPASQDTAAQPETTPQVPQTQPAPPVESRCREMHRVKRKETVFSISRKYGISESELRAANPELRQSDKLKKGSLLCIPYPQATVKEPEQQQQAPTDQEIFGQSTPKNERLGTIKAAVVLPFLDVPKGEADRMVEYYEGLLLAVDSLKRTGTSIDLYTYNTGSEKTSLNALLQKQELKEMDVIFGPLHGAHIKPLADFARQHQTRLVVPFTSKDNTVYRNPAVYQINTPQSYLYSEVYEHFVRQFAAANIVFIEATHGAKEKVDFVKGLKETLREQGIKSRSVSENATPAEYKEAMAAGRPNIFIPTSGSNVTLIKILPQLTLTVRENPETEIHLFGYPEWQTYTKDHLDAFFELDTYFYSSFYTNNLLPAARQFTRNYRRWYGKEMDERYPKFGMLGFDTAFFFLKGLSRFGNQFEQSMDQMRLTPIQTGFKFQRVNNWGGFINRKVFFVRFTKNYELLKLDFD